MKLESIRIQNFRAFKDQTIQFDDYTCIVGANGAGKSSVLHALNVFFRNTSSSTTDVTHLSQEDFHHCNTNEPACITLTFSDLSEEATKALRHYVRQKKLTVRSKATWNKDKQSAEVRQYGVRMVMEQFAPYFAAMQNKAKAPALKEIYKELKSDIPALPDVATIDGMADALRAYEELRPELCQPLEADTQFFGFTKGGNLMDQYIQWVYIPAVKDASTEQNESAKSALGQLLDRTVRAKVDFQERVQKIKQLAESEYKKIVESEKQVLTDVEKSLQGRLRQWATPDATLQLEWNVDPDKSVVVNEPSAKAKLGEDKFLGEVARLGHGMQRSFLVSILQELAETDAAKRPRLLLGFEEPELYQHPPQAQHVANMLEDMATTQKGNAQVILSTHSPHFVSTKGYTNIRMMRKHRKDKCTLVSSTNFEKLSGALAKVTGEKIAPTPALMSKLEQIMQPAQKELFFTRFAVFVEGIEDIAFTATHLKLTERWDEFRRLGCHFIPVVGKTNMTRPLAIAQELCIGTFAIFDADGTKEKQIERDKRDNAWLLKLCGEASDNPLPGQTVWGQRMVMWKTNIASAVMDDLGADVWTKAEDAARKIHNLEAGVERKNNMLIAATLVELHSAGVVSGVLTKLCDNLLKVAAESGEGG